MGEFLCVIHKGNGLFTKPGLFGKLNTPPGGKLPEIFPTGNKP